jgi:hypothetical protein
MRSWLMGALVAVAVTAGTQVQPTAYLPGGRVLLDAHNAYPEDGRFADRINRALATGLPLAIEQDLAWCHVRATDRLEPVVAHEPACTGTEPTLRAYFFDRVQPLLDAALAHGVTRDWPLITLNLDFKTNEPAHHAAVLALLGEYDRWLTTAIRSVDGAPPSPLRVGPLLVLTGDNDVQEQTFATGVPVGSRLRVFGAIQSQREPAGQDPTARPRATPATSYRRWWNHPWSAVEVGGQRTAGEWTRADAERLQALVADAHAHGLWLRLYTLNGHAPSEGAGWTASYNFGSLAAVTTRWQAAAEAGVDFIATDQYDAFASWRRGAATSSRPSAELPP